MKDIVLHIEPLGHLVRKAQTFPYCRFGFKVWDIRWLCFDKRPCRLSFRLG
ncbi:MAG: hypothetical protein ACTTKO_06940 [Candidatus Limimorpha sp.]